ncbi:MAG: hypothetical protein CUN56_05350 [Phototrophicales bacterium]|nr:MAG: hypothetical protein CUN56_05350 [Phototrophicales bacterium]RMG73833.1 MAG: hypothetical protein D6711_10110 [Chloroflexota bacterium]
MTEITVVDFNATESGAMTLIDVFENLQKQIAMIAFAMDHISETGRGEWIEALQDDMENLMDQIDNASVVAVELSEFLLNMVVTFRGYLTVDDDFGEDF